MSAESQELKDAGLKITLPRIKILQILESSDVHHVSAEDVYKLLLENGEEIKHYTLPVGAHELSIRAQVLSWGYWAFRCLLCCLC